jgi:PAS domain-containing protein
MHLDFDTPLLSHLLVEVAEPFCLYDATGQSIYASPKLLDLLQVNEASDLCFFSYFAAPLQAGILQDVWQSLWTKQSGSIVFAANLSALHPIECRLWRIIPPGLAPSLVAMVVYESVANQDLLTALLAESRQQVDSFLNHSDRGIAFVSLEGQLGRRNNCFCEMFRLDQQQEATIESLMPPGEVFLNPKMLNSLKNAGHYATTQRYRVSGQEMWLETRVSLIQPPESEPYFLLTVFPRKLIGKLARKSKMGSLNYGRLKRSRR